MQTQARRVFERWVDVGETSVVAASLCAVAWYAFPTTASRSLMLPATMPLWMQMACFASLVAILLTQFRSALPHSLKSIRYWPKYPPSWFAALPVIAMAVVGLPFDLVDYALVALTLLFGYIFACVTPLIAGPRHAPRAAPIRVGDQKRSLFKSDGTVDLAMLNNWLDREQPIEESGDDFFGAQIVADSIWKKIDASCRVALLGPYGSGKSSVVALTRLLAERNGDWTVTIDGWGPKPTEVPEVVLRKIVQLLGKYVDVLQLTSLPTRYRAALTGTRSAPVAVFNELTSHAPNEVLDRLDQVLGALGRRLVIFLEDMDRQAAGETLQSVASLLDRLRRLSHVSFVISIDPMRQESIDIIRLCEHSASMLPIDEKIAHQLLDEFLANCTTRNEYIEPSRSRIDAWRITRSADRIAFALSDGRYEDVRALLRLIRTPRVMKSVLRQVRAAWEQLFGEVDLIELLIEECFRIVCPTVWQLVGDEINEFRNIRSGWESFSDRARERREADRKQLAERVHRAVEADGVSQDAVERLIRVLFPGWQSEPANVKENAQLARISEPTDYWKRMVRQTIVESPTDQQVFRAINSWRDLKSSQLPDLLYESGHAGQTLERFAHLLPKEDILPLAGALHAEMIKRDHSLANLDRTDSAISIWRMAIQQPLDGFNEFVMNQIERSLPKSLMLAIDIGYYWSTELGREGIPRDEIYAFTREKAAECYVDLVTLTEALPPLSAKFNPFSLHQLIVAGQLSLEIEPSTLAERWTWLMEVLASGEVHGPRVVVQVLGLFSKEVELEFRQRELRFDDDFARTLIPDDNLRSRVFRATLAGWPAMSQDEREAIKRFQTIFDEIRRRYGVGVVI